MVFIKILTGEIPLVIKSTEISLLKLKRVDDWGSSIKIELGNESCTVVIQLHKQEFLQIVKQLSKKSKVKEHA